MNIKSKHQSIIPLKQDISDHANLESFIDKCNEKLNGRIDILINNAGITKDNLTIRMDKEEWSKL